MIACPTIALTRLAAALALMVAVAGSACAQQFFPSPEAAANALATAAKAADIRVLLRLSLIHI